MFRRRANSSVHWFIEDLSARVIAESGIPSDRFHLGKLILQSFKDAPDFISQIDGGTGVSETCQSVLERTVKCATAFRNIGLQRGDVVVLMGPNHLDMCIPFYASFCAGVIAAPLDRTYTVKELYGSFSVLQPKLVFCQSQRAPDVQLAVNQLEQMVEIITFDKGDYLDTFAEFVEKNCDDTPTEDFRATDFDPDETIALLIPTSGTTGASKSAAISHKNFTISCPYVWIKNCNFPSPTRMGMIGSPLQWLSAILHFVLSPILRYTKLQTSSVFNQEHAYYLINKYKPTYTILSPPFMFTLIKPGERDKCDFSCLELLMLGGSAVPIDLVDELKTLMPNTEVLNVFGMTELSSIVFCNENSPPGSCGKPLGCYEYRLIDTETGNDIDIPNQPGELWVNGPGVFKGYYNNPKATEDSFAEGRWFKTGDMFYRDENFNFFFVERIKLLLKYKSYHMSPVEIESVIRSHPGVLDAAVTAIPDPECGDLPVACVVRRSGSEVTAQEIKDLVKESLSDAKQLRGGVIFMNELPLTAATKIHRIQLKKMVVIMEKE